MDKYLSIYDKWNLDVESYEKGAKAPTAYPQCESCAHYVKGDVFHCKIYMEEKKPKDVAFAEKECENYANADPLQIDIDSEKKDRFFGGIFGFCIGDMLGVPVEFSSRAERDHDPVKELRAYGTYHQPFGSWSDDSSLMLALIAALMSEDVLETLKNNMIAYYREGLFTPRGKMFDIGNSTRYAINNMERGLPAVKCGGTSQQDNGNGSLMRILPLAYLETENKEEELIRLIEDVSSLTHRHPRSKLACIFYTVFASRLYNGMDKESALDDTLAFIDRYCRQEYKKELSYYRNILDKTIFRADRNQIRSSGYVVDTLEAVMWSFFHTTSYEEAVLTAVNLGGDTDTIAALAGGLSGIYYGFQKIPSRWIQSVLKKKEIADLSEKYFEYITEKKDIV